MVNKILKKRRSVPYFPRPDAHKKAKLNTAWRTPKGHLGRWKKLSLYKGHQPKIGFGTKFKHVASNGMVKIEVANLKELTKIDAKTQGIIIKNVGQRKKIDIVKEALQKKIKIFNLRKPEEFLEKSKK